MNQNNKNNDIFSKLATTGTKVTNTYNKDPMNVQVYSEEIETSSTKPNPQNLAPTKNENIPIITSAEEIENQMSKLSNMLNNPKSTNTTKINDQSVQPYQNIGQNRYDRQKTDPQTQYYNNTKQIGQYNAPGTDSQPARSDRRQTDSILVNQTTLSQNNEQN